MIVQIAEIESPNSSFAPSRESSIPRDRSMGANRFPNRGVARELAATRAKPPRSSSVQDLESTAAAAISSASVPGNEPHPRLYSQDLMRAIRMHRIPQSQ